MNKKILVVDDDTTILSALKMALEDEGFDVMAHPDGKIINELNGANHPDVVVLDIMLAGEDGRDLAKKIKSKDKQIPVIMISAMADAKASALKAGADYFLPKPFDLDELLDTAENACANPPC